MNHYQTTIQLSAPAATVYAALTTPAGIAGWWTRDCTVGTAAGETVTVRFGTTYKVLRIERLEPLREVGWRCIDSYLHVPGIIDAKDEWKDHELIFRLREHSATATTLAFDHIGLNPSVACYDICTGGWAQFLSSLQAYVQTGTGRPYSG